MRSSNWRKFLLAATLVFVLSGVSVFAQSGSTNESKRMNIAGKVRIEIVIFPDEHLKSTRVLRGHLLLVEGCQEAVKEWKFAPGSEETQIVECEFHTGNLWHGAGRWRRG